jgi:hypothetical protein
LTAKKPGSTVAWEVATIRTASSWLVTSCATSAVAFRTITPRKMVLPEAALLFKKARRETVSRETA